MSVCAAAFTSLIAAHAQGTTRAGHFETSLGGGYTGSKSLSFDNGAKADVDGSWGFLFGIAYNLSERVSLGGEFGWSSLGYSTTVAPAAGNPAPPVNLRGTAYASSAAFNATYHFLPGPITPYVSGTLGFVYVDTGMPSGPPVNGCWWYPWWGYVCGPVVPTKTTTDFTYGVGAGLRWDLNEKFFLRAGLQQFWWTMGDAEGTPSFTSYRADFGFKF
jgi:opacity protein-like surface antigen